VAPPQSGQPNQPHFLHKLTVHHCYFEPMVGMLSDWTKGWDFAPEDKRYLSSIVYKYIWSSCLIEEEIWVKDIQKTSLSNLVSAASRTSFSLSQPLRSAANIVTTGFNTSISITTNCLNTSYSERTAEPLSSATFLLPLPATDTDHHSVHRSLLSHQQNLLVAAKLPLQVSLLPLPFLLLLLLLPWSPLFTWTMESNPLFNFFKKKLIPKNLF